MTPLWLPIWSFALQVAKQQVNNNPVSEIYGALDQCAYERRIFYGEFK